MNRRLSKCSNYQKAALALSAIGGMALCNIAQADTAVTLNGQPLATSIAPIQRNGRTLVPMRDIFEALGATVSWNAVAQGITATRGATTVGMQIGNRVASVNDQHLMLGQPPVLFDGHTMVPLRFVSEALGAQVNWNSALQMVSIRTTGGDYGRSVASARTISVPAGVVVPVTLDNDLSSATARPGDRFSTTVKYTHDGDSEFPPGTRIDGVVTQAQPRQGDNPGILDLSFRDAVLPDGTRYPLSGELTALDSNSVARSTDGHIIAKNASSNGDRNKIIGVGAGAGYAIGHLLLKQNGLLSAVLGAAGGYLYDRSKNKAADATLRSGTALGVQLDRSVEYADNSGYSSRRSAYYRR